jgi:hypothetical protein
MSPVDLVTRAAAGPACAALDRPESSVPALRWADIPELFTCGGSCPAAWQQLGGTVFIIGPMVSNGIHAS